MMNSSKKLILIDWLLPMDGGRPIRKAYLLIEKGLIKDFGLQVQLSSEGDCLEQNLIIEKLPGGILMPGLINTHIHLAYKTTALDDCQDEIDWLKKIVQESRSMTQKDKISLAKENVKAVLKGGCTFVVENTPFDETVEAIAESRLKALLGIEVFGNKSSQAEMVFQNSLAKLKSLEEKFQSVTPRLQFTFSPHSIYNVADSLMQLLSVWAKQNDRFLLLHLAEFAFESELTQEHKLPAKLLDLYNLLGVTGSEIANKKNTLAAMNPVQYLKEIQCLHKKMVLTHLINVSEEDIKTLKESDALLALCLRSNLLLHKKIPPSSLFRSTSSQISFGTDGLSSNYDLDLIHEISHNFKLLKANGLDASSQSLFESITSIPAAKLGLKMGAIKRGNPADLLCFVPNSKESQKELSEKNIFDYLLEELSNFTRQVWVDGESI
ncbi:MAG: amidohydrolase family protein [Candidatus Caenarcaniphilales bacterium]|nr:amidohydrolase family protein [Candidatus Caenarcaniphilales bacterium]